MGKEGGGMGGWWEGEVGWALEEKGETGVIGGRGGRMRGGKGEKRVGG